MTANLDAIGTIEVHPGQKERFKSEELWREWAEMYPDIFDADDVRIAKSQAYLGHHFYEWLAAILLYHSTGYLSLVEQYEFKNHKRKQEIVQRLFSPELIELIAHHERFGGVQCPDLLIYTRDFSNWFFCEVKGPTDKLTNVQEQYFQALAELGGKSVRLIKFRTIQG